MHEGTTVLMLGVHLVPQDLNLEPTAAQHTEEDAMLTRSHQLLTLICIVSLISGCRNNDDGQWPAVEGPFTPANISLREQGNLKELLDEKLTFVDSNGVEWVAPQGTLTDGASVPRLALPITDGRWDEKFLKAAVVHDAYCQEENKTRTPDQYRTKPWQSVHRMFYEACIAGGTDPLLAKIMFAGVWLAGPKWGDYGTELQQISSEVLTRGFIGSKAWIEKNDPTVEEIEADIERRGPLLLDLYKLESEILTALQYGDTTKAHALLQGEEALLSKELDRSPDDLMLLNFKGYWHKNRAMLYRTSGIENKARDELNISERTFHAVIENEKADPAALNGLGSVAILRGDLDRGELFIKEALRYAPNYEAAKHDLELIERLRESQPPE